MNIVTLIDGRQVDSASEDWRFECEARHLLSMPTKGDRLCYLDGWVEYEGRPPHVKTIKHPGIVKKRGKEYRDALQALAMKIWKQRQDSKNKSS